mgnify:CR=1 FL=1
MPKVGAEPIRKAALINATIETVGRTGSLDVTVAQIAREAGMSPALAHHYFGSKGDIFLAAMRHILSRYGDGVRAALVAADGPAGRLRGIVDESLAGGNFDLAAMSAWLNFYALAPTDPQAARLLRVYHRRLRSNLIHALRPLVNDAAAEADRLAALIDGAYLRAVLDPDMPPDRARALVMDEVRRITG